MRVKNDEQIQVRIDSKTKNEAKKILDSLGMDISSAIKIFFRQIINTKNFPCELRGADGLTLQNYQELKKAIVSAEKSKKSFKTGKSLIGDALKD